MVARAPDFSEDGRRACRRFSNISDARFQSLGDGFVGSRRPGCRSSSLEWRRSKGWNSPSWWDLQLSIALVAQSNAQGVLDLCDKHLQQLHLVNAATALHRIAKAADSHNVLEQRGLYQLIVRLHNFMADSTTDVNTGAVSLANVFWACAKIGYMDMPLFSAISSQARRQVNIFDCQECSNMCWAFATLEILDENLMLQLRAKSAELLSNFSMQDLSNTAWSYSKMGILDEPLMVTVSTYARRKLREGIPQNLTNLAWSYATLLLQNAPLLEAVAPAAVNSIPEYEVQDLSNTVWAFSICNFYHGPLLQVAAEEVIARTHTLVCRVGQHSKAELQDCAFALVSVAWVYAFMASWSAQLCESLTRHLDRVGNELDARCGMTHVASAEARRHKLDNAASNRSLSEPFFEMDRPGMVVIMKPPGWEVDGPQTERGNQALLSDFLQANFSRADYFLPHAPDFQYGFIHRLDVPSSGLILVGTTFAGLYSLRLQINTFAMRREYCVLSHGLMPSSLRECHAKIDMVAKRSMEGCWGIGEYSISDHGKPALTWFTCSGHLRRGLTSHTLVIIRIHTGRNHQIRTHLLHCFHPTVVDGKYTCRSVLLSSQPPFRMTNVVAQCPAQVSSISGKHASTVSPTLKRLPRATSGIELRAMPGEDKQDGKRRPHLWAWKQGTGDDLVAEIL